ncbi:Coiled-coil domain-containing protein 61, partial [Cricetulus griseus]
TLPSYQPTVLQVDYFFRGVEHAVRVVVSGQVLELEVEDRMTADQWRGEFDANFIEDLTHKTGNFKQFSIFCNMLESALTQSSESVTLDLLTYTDLESLRSRKLGGRPGSLAPRSAQLNSKRYLILIYSVEFDRWAQWLAEGPGQWAGWEEPPVPGGRDAFASPAGSVDSVVLLL